MFSVLYEGRKKRERRVSATENIYYEWKMIFSHSVIVWFICGTAVAIKIMPNMTIANIASFGIVSPPMLFRGSKEG
jgi:hypothetical protein